MALAVGAKTPEGLYRHCKITALLERTGRSLAQYLSGRPGDSDSGLTTVRRNNRDPH
ncbi:hypothetical protein BH09ACT10_BH09ACT10_00040 [soil metagenome]